MMKKYASILMMLILSSFGAMPQDWVSITSNPQMPTTISTTRSTSSQVKFTVFLPGFVSKMKSEGTKLFQRVSLSEQMLTGETGTPNIPTIFQLVAIPEYSQITYSVQVLSSQMLTGYALYPIPERGERHEDGLSYVEEAYALNAAAYAQNTNLPGTYYQVMETGYIRSQKFIRPELYPMQCNPA
ncbi:MAG: hypothetical protein LBH92_00400 [Bacteroidales bacterium]|jgi:hypothetical protein|nr:hypothetical protein [Bacteroidales bacterium]